MRARADPLGRILSDGSSRTDPLGRILPGGSSRTDPLGRLLSDPLGRILSDGSSRTDPLGSSRILLDGSSRTDPLGWMLSDRPCRRRRCVPTRCAPLCCRRVRHWLDPSRPAVHIAPERGAQKTFPKCFLTTKNPTEGSNRLSPRGSLFVAMVARIELLTPWIGGFPLGGILL